MLNSIVKYYPLNSRIHQMNVIAKIICIILFVITTLLTCELKSNILIGILFLLMILNTNISIKIFLKLIYYIKWLLLIILIFCLFLNFNIMTTLIILLKPIYTSIYILILLLTTTTNELMYGLDRLFLPLKLIGINTNKIILSIMLFLKFIETYINENNLAKKQINKKHFKLKKSFLLKISKRKIKQLSLNIKIRFYNISKKRSCFRKRKWKLYDIFLILLHLSLFILVVKGV